MNHLQLQTSFKWTFNCSGPSVILVIFVSNGRDKIFRHVLTMLLSGMSMNHVQDHCCKAQILKYSDYWYSTGTGNV